MSDVAGQVREWWADHPMTYGDVHGQSAEALGTPAFFAEVDARFLEWNRPAARRASVRADLPLRAPPRRARAGGRLRDGDDGVVLGAAGRTG